MHQYVNDSCTTDYLSYQWKIKHLNLNKYRKTNTCSELQHHSVWEQDVVSVFRGQMLWRNRLKHLGVYQISSHSESDMQLSGSRQEVDQPVDLTRAWGSSRSADRLFWSINDCSVGAFKEQSLNLGLMLLQLTFKGSVLFRAVKKFHLLGFVLFSSLSFESLLLICWRNTDDKLKPNIPLRDACHPTSGGDSGSFESTESLESVH